MFASIGQLNTDPNPAITTQSIIRLNAARLMGKMLVFSSSVLVRLISSVDSCPLFNDSLYVLSEFKFLLLQPLAVRSLNNFLHFWAHVVIIDVKRHG
jgi:hypothetical protein